MGEVHHGGRRAGSDAACDPGIVAQVPGYEDRNGQRNDPRLPADALAAVLEHNRMLLRLAKPIVRQLYALIRSTQDIITLHTMQGCIIDIVSDEQIIRGSYKEGYRIGALWTEENIGSNAAELCVRSDQPIQMVGAEHYNRLSHQATCYAAPIHDPNGTLIAVLNVAGLATHTSPYIMAMTTMTAFAIERQLLLQGSYDLLQRSFDLMSDGIVVTDCSCQITRYNKRALDLFCAQSDEIRQLSLKEILTRQTFTSAWFASTGTFRLWSMSFPCLEKRRCCAGSASLRSSWITS